MTVGSTLSVLVLQAMTLRDGPDDLTFTRLPGWIAGWLGFTSLLAAGTVGGIFPLVILLVKGDGLLWGSASMIMATVGLIPLLAIRLRR